MPPYEQDSDDSDNDSAAGTINSLASHFSAVTLASAVTERTVLTETTASTSGTANSADYEQDWQRLLGAYYHGWLRRTGIKWVRSENPDRRDAFVAEFERMRAEQQILIIEPAPDDSPLRKNRDRLSRHIRRVTRMQPGPAVSLYILIDPDSLYFPKEKNILIAWINREELPNTFRLETFTKEESTRLVGYPMALQAEPGPASEAPAAAETESSM